MGLDQFAYAINSSGEKREIAYWRKHPHLQGWMENLWEIKGRPGDRNENNTLGDFNCIPVELTKDDLDGLEEDITNSHLPRTNGFFFGDDSDDHYKEYDLHFVENARRELDEGNKVVYDSWW